MVRHLSKAEVFEALAVTAAELLFAILPLLVLSIVVFARQNSLRDVAASPEWSFGSAIITGQTVVRFVVGLIRAKQVKGGPVTLVLAGFFVFGIVPTLTILVLVTQAEHRVAAWLMWTQLGIFCVSMAVFLVLGSLGHIWIESAGTAHHTNIAR